MHGSTLTVIYRFYVIYIKSVAILSYWLSALIECDNDCSIRDSWAFCALKAFDGLLSCYATNAATFSGV